MQSFFEQVWGPLDGLYGEIRVIGRKTTGQIFVTTADQASIIAAEQDGAGIDVYYGVLPRLRQSGKASDCAPNTHVIWLDLDAKGFGDSKSRALAALTHLAIHPSIIVDSGHGYHAYYLLRRSVPFDKAQRAMKLLVERSGADPKSTDTARILRVPGTHNYKDGGSEPVRLLYFDPGNRHFLSDFDGYAQVEGPDHGIGSNPDIRAQAEEYDILAVLTEAGAQFKKLGSVYMAQCIFHEDHTPSLAAYPANESFYCFGCGAWGDALNVEKWKATGRLR